jgi:F-type H+-transporting ATPase subunit gamma
MATAKEVKGRIKSVKNISQITRALEAVSASRVRKAQELASASREYSEKAWEILLNIQNMTRGSVPHPLLTEREEIKSVLVVLITSDRGLAGAYNTNITRVATRFEERFDGDVKYLTVGKKGRDSLIRMGKEVIAEFSDLPPNPTIADISPISQLAVEAFLSGEVDEVVIAYTDFINMLTQRPVVLGWLPLTPHTEAEKVASDYVKDVPQVTDTDQDYEYEPTAVAVVDEIVPRFTELQLYQALLESQASEHAARMNAMRNATDNASQLVDDLTLEYNKARQAAITSEILDIVGGAAALENTERGGSSENGNGSKAKQRRQKSKQQSKAIAVADAPAEKPAGKPDDFTVIKGVGKKMSQALIEGGITTYTQLASKSEEEIQAVLEKTGMRFAPSIPTWAEQAAYAAKGDWDGLQAFQDTLVAGRRVDDEE